MSIALVHGTVAERQTQREVGAKREREWERERETDRQTDRQRKGVRESVLLPLTEPVFI